ncbi:MAG TPA: methylisocitrate lyase, partial [Isosphaeraceae bacterium]|nr:methylisocitrate lyase [Isosphaeraceae bacterium]
GFFGFEKETAMPSPGERLRMAWSERAIKIPGAFNALVAKQAERLGFAAVYLSGGALSAGWAGLPDVGLLTLTEFAEQAAVLARATALPVLCDADTGFGEVINVARAVSLFEEAGVAGMHLEDQVLPKRCGHLSGKALVDEGAMVAKIRAAVASKRDPAFVVVARTDARSVEGFDAAVKRAQAYLAAGADMVFPEALESREEFARFAKSVSAPLLANMTEFGRSPLLSFDDLAAMGYRAVLYPLTAFRAAMRAAQEALTQLRDLGTQAGLLEKMQTRAELYDLLGYNDWEARDRAYFSGPEGP